MSERDPRLTPARPDLAAERLRGLVEAARFVAGEPRRVVVPSAGLRREPRSDAGIETEALMGDLVTVYEETIEGWAWAELAIDGYVGYLPVEALGAAVPVPTHRVASLRTFVYPAAEMRLPPVAQLSMGASVAVAGETEKRGLAYALLADGRAIVARHLVPLTAKVADWVAVAERFVGTPYLWGGATAQGLDCSGLVQLAGRMASLAVPRDTDLQEAGFGHPVPLDTGRTRPARGDLLFWPGHVAIRLDGKRLLHASGFHMEVVVEPEAATLARLTKAGVHLRSIRRLPR